MKTKSYQKNAKIANLYAEAVLQSAVEMQVDLDAFQRELPTFIEELGKNHIFDFCIRAKHINLKTKDVIWQKIAKTIAVPKVLFLLVKLLIKNKRENLLLHVLYSLEKKLSISQQEIPVKLSTAVELTTQQIERIQLMINKIVDGCPKISIKIDKSLIAGILIEWNFNMIDLSTKNKISQMRMFLLKEAR